MNVLNETDLVFERLREYEMRMDKEERERIERKNQIALIGTAIAIITAVYSLKKR